MRKFTIRTGFAAAVLVLAVAGNAGVFALPVKQPVHSPEPVTNINTPSPTTTTDTGSNDSGTTPSSPPASSPTGTTSPPASAPTPQQVCESHENAINTITKRIDTRTQNQITLFDTIATRVENFYGGQPQVITNYSQLADAITAAKTQAGLDLSALQTNSTIDCNSDPKDMVMAFQAEVKTTTNDLQSYRTAVKNLIAAVGKADGVAISSSSTTNGQGGQQ